MSVSTYVLTDGGNTIVTYPYSTTQLIQANPTVSFPVPVPDSVAEQFNTFPVQDTARPPFNPMTQNLSLVDPVRQDGVWFQQWSVTEATPEEQAERLATYRANLQCTPLQGKIELENQGLLDAAEAEVANADKITRLAWNNATIWYRTSPMIETLGAGLGLSADDLDNLFVQAAQITV